jgi:hypothetical protein
VINLTTNSFFKHKENHKFIGDKTQNNFDYIITKQVNTFNIYNIRVCREADCGSDHRLLKMELSCPWIKQMTANIKQNQPRIDEAQEEKFNVELLQDESIRTLFV